MGRTVFTTMALALLVPAQSGGVEAGDWPMWRYDAGRGAASPHALPETLNLQWVRELPAPRPAWPSTQRKLQFDRSYEPVVMGERLFVGSSVDDSIRAYRTRDGRELWRFFTDAPVRFAPVAVEGRIYAVSDDGYLYCLNAEDGKLLWKVNGGPAVRPIIGNHRLVSSWPARGGPVYADGVVYFAASIWPSMGIFVHAVDAETGRILWTNSRTGSLYVVHPHGAPSFGSVAPQGHLAIAGDSLIVPGGRSTPAVFNRKTGKLRHFRFDKRSGHHRVVAGGDFYFVSGESYLLEDGRSAGSARADILTADLVISSHSGKIVASELKGRVSRRKTRDRRGRIQTKLQPDITIRWTLRVGRDAMLMAGNRIYTVGKNRIKAFPVPKSGTVESKPVWTAEVTGTISNMLAADERLFVVTQEGRIYCFGGEKTELRKHHLQQHTPGDGRAERAGGPSTELVRLCKMPSRDSAQAEPAVCVVYGLSDSGSVARELTELANVRVIAVEADATTVRRFRESMSAEQQYGRRLSARVGNGVHYPLPPYLASYSVCLDAESAGIDFTAESVGKLYRPLRPYGGTACLKLPAKEHAEFAKAVTTASLPGAVVSRNGNYTLLKRVGPLPNTAGWTHQYGDAANSVVSKDDRVKAPLGVLWFGGPSHEKILPRHGHGPNPQVAGGRLVIEGPDILRAVDVYTGRLLWEQELRGIGTYYNTTRHFPGAGEVGSNYVTLPDAVYVVYGNRILELDAATGEERRSFTRNVEGSEEPPLWGTMVVSDDYLVATATPVRIGGSKSGFEPTKYSSASKRLVVFNRKTGKLLWQREATFNFRHNCVIAAAGKVFCIDGLSPEKIQRLKRRGIDASGKAKLLALDVKTGREIWSATDDVFGTFLNYSKQHDVLLQAGSAYRDRARDEVSRGMVAYRGKTGNVLWKDRDIKYGGPCLLWRDKIITNGSGGYQLELHTGKRTGWTYSRMYGCNTAVGSRNLLTFRSGAAGFYDLTGDSGTGNIGGFRSSCTSNLIPADGVLNAPDYTRTCSCAYQNQTSLALVHMPENEFWTFNRRRSDLKTAKRIGLNLGAPGDRQSTAGTLWMDVPSVGGPSPDLNVKTEPADVTWFQRHSSFLKTGKLKWVTASGGKGIRKLTLTIAPDAKTTRKYTARLFFAEPDDVKPGQRAMTVALQKKVVVDSLDVVREAGGKDRGLVREFPGITARGTLEIELTPAPGSKRPPILCGVELIRDE